MLKRMRLLNPGPVTLTRRVRESLLKEDLCHREPEFSEMQSRIRSQLSTVYEGAQDYEAVLVTGSGTSAVEMMIGSLVPKEGKALIAANGVYGERMAKMLRAQSKAIEVIQSEWIRPIDFDRVEKALASSSFTHVIAVHHETTTGRLNDLHRLGGLCKKYNTPLLLDAVSSFGGEEICFQEWNLEALAATANKCLHGVPAVSFVLARRNALEGKPSAATSVYLDLHNAYEAQKKGSSAFTQSVHGMYALNEALEELRDQGGWRERHRRYSQHMQIVVEGMRELGIEPLLESEEASSRILIGYRLPSRARYEDLHAHLKRAGFVIYSGQGKFDGEIFRVAVMGDLGRGDFEELIGEFRTFLQKLN